MYREGMGIPQNEIIAYTLFNVAASQSADNSFNSE